MQQEWLQDDEGVLAEEPGFCGGLIVALGINGACHATLGSACSGLICINSGLIWINPQRNANCFYEAQA